MNRRKRKNAAIILKAIATLVIFIFFGYYSYQGQIGQRVSGKGGKQRTSLPQHHSNNNSKYSYSLPQDTQQAQELKKRLNALSREQAKEICTHNDIDAFNDNLEDFLSDPEDELTYPPEVYEDQLDDEEKDYIENELDY